MNGQAAAIILLLWLGFWYFFVGKSKDGGLMVWGALTGLMLLGVVYEVGRWLLK